MSKRVLLVLVGVASLAGTGFAGHAVQAEQIHVMDDSGYIVFLHSGDGSEGYIGVHAGGVDCGLSSEEPDSDPNTSNPTPGSNPCP